MTETQKQIQNLIDEHERIKSQIEWIEWYKIRDNAQREIDELEAEIALLQKRVRSVLDKRDDTKSVPILRERASFVLQRIMLLEEKDKQEREAHRPRVSTGPRIGELSAKASRELATSLGMSVEELVKIMNNK
jgi:hypothetical protein